MTVRKKLLITTSSFPRWENDKGLPFVYELAGRMTEEFEVSVLAPHWSGAKVEEKIGDIKVYRFRYFFERFEKLAGGGGILPTLKKHKMYYLLVPLFLLGQFLKFRKIVKADRPDIVHAHWVIPQGVVAAVIKKFYKVPFLVTAHGSDISALKGKFLKQFQKFVLKNANSVSVVSNALKEEAQRHILKTDNIAVLPMGVDSDVFKPLENVSSVRNKYGIDGQMLLFVGRLNEQKGVRYLLEAMPEIINRFPKVKLLIVGAGTLETEFKELVKILEIENSVIFAGTVDNKELPQFYSSSDLLVGPSVGNEGLGLAFVEAGMCGCVCIGTDVGGIGDVIEDGETGFIVEQKNSGQLAERIISLLGNPEKCEKMGAAAREKLVEEFDWEIVSGKYVRVLSCS